ncbi:uncharacterized protein isoform X2 [Choristoneura fumiferana]|uniref:uncharacterized protein isoform X2 n=1 Tax=Choristoneura fumiferana TaxID=7141 RepID=UPI003D15B835
MDVSSLRDVKILVEPPIVIRNETASIICYRDMQGAPVYSVKWYRGNHEFYRYTPQETPSTKEFGLLGIYVDTNRSDGEQVVLRRLDLSLAGNFSCEVTADTSFTTAIAYKFIDVIAIPLYPPILMAEKERYQPGELLRANCTSSPAKPPANLTIYINDEPHRSSETSFQPSESGLYSTSVAVELKVTPDLFPSGRLRVTCNATMYNVYNESAKLDFFTPDTDPRPERITLNGQATKNFTSWLLLLFLLLLPMVFSQDYRDFNEDTFGEVGNNYEEFDGTMYFERNPKHPFLSLIGP